MHLRMLILATLLATSWAEESQIISKITSSSNSDSQKDLKTSASSTSSNTASASVSSSAAASVPSASVDTLKVSETRPQSADYSEHTEHSYSQSSSFDQNVPASSNGNTGYQSYGSINNQGNTGETGYSVAPESSYSQPQSGNHQSPASYSTSGQDDSNAGHQQQPANGQGGPQAVYNGGQGVNEIADYRGGSSGKEYSGEGGDSFKTSVGYGAGRGAGAPQFGDRNPETVYEPSGDYSQGGQDSVNNNNNNNNGPQYGGSTSSGYQDNQDSGEDEGSPYRTTEPENVQSNPSQQAQQRPKSSTLASPGPVPDYGGFRPVLRPNIQIQNLGPQNSDEYSAGPGDYRGPGEGMSIQTYPAKAYAYTVVGNEGNSDEYSGEKIEIAPYQGGRGPQDSYGNGGQAGGRPQYHPLHHPREPVMGNAGYALDYGTGKPYGGDLTKKPYSIDSRGNLNKVITMPMTYDENVKPSGQGYSMQPAQPGSGSEFGSQAFHYEVSQPHDAPGSQGSESNYEGSRGFSGPYENKPVNFESSGSYEQGGNFGQSSFEHQPRPGVYGQQVGPQVSHVTHESSFAPGESFMNSNERPSVAPNGGYKMGPSVSFEGPSSPGSPAGFMESSSYEGGHDPVSGPSGPYHGPVGSVSAASNVAGSERGVGGPSVPSSVESAYGPASSVEGDYSSAAFGGSSFAEGMESPASGQPGGVGGPGMSAFNSPALGGYSLPDDSYMQSLFGFPAYDVGSPKGHPYLAAAGSNMVPASFGPSPPMRRPMGPGSSGSSSSSSSSSSGGMSSFLPSIKLTSSGIKLSGFGQNIGTGGMGGIGSSLNSALASSFGSSLRPGGSRPGSSSGSSSVGGGFGGSLSSLYNSLGGLGGLGGPFGGLGGFNFGGNSQNNGNGANAASASKLIPQVIRAPLRTMYRAIMGNPLAG